jgi:hypothetical protein
LAAWKGLACEDAETADGRGLPLPDIPATVAGRVDGREDPAGAEMEAAEEGLAAGTAAGACTREGGRNMETMCDRAERM